MDIVLQTQTSNPALILRQIERLGGAAPHYSARLVVRSGDFAAERDFYFDEYVLEQFLEALRAADRTLTGTACLGEQYEGQDFLQLEVRPRGQVFVTGELVQYSEAGTQRLEFAFATDQTCLRPLISDLDACRGHGPTGLSAQAS